MITNCETLAEFFHWLQIHSVNVLTGGVDWIHENTSPLKCRYMQKLCIHFHRRSLDYLPFSIWTFAPHLPHLLIPAEDDHTLITTWQHFRGVCSRWQSQRFQVNFWYFWLIIFRVHHSPSGNICRETDTTSALYIVHVWYIIFIEMVL